MIAAHFAKRSFGRVARRRVRIAVARGGAEGSARRTAAAATVGRFEEEAAKTRVAVRGRGGTIFEGVCTRGKETNKSTWTRVETRT